MHSVIHIFRQHNALTIKDAKTADELDLGPKPFMSKLSKPRDYKPYALQILIGANIVRVTEDGRLYLAEEQLATSRWSNVK
jgi:hypothetical protein